MAVYLWRGLNGSLAVASNWLVSAGVATSLPGSADFAELGTASAIGGVLTAGTISIDATLSLSGATNFTAPTVFVGNSVSGGLVVGGNALSFAGTQFILGLSAAGLLSIGAGGVVNLGTAGFTLGQNSGGAGTLQVGTGGTLLTGSSTLSGGGATATGLAVLSGAGALWSDAGTLSIGGQGSGAVTLDTGATLQTVGQVTVGQFGTGIGTLEIDNGGTLLAGSNPGTVPALTVGGNAGSTGHVTITAGGLLKVATTPQINNFSVVVGSTGTGTLLVTGAGARLDTGGNPLAIGESGGNGSVTVSNGGSLIASVLDSNQFLAIRIGRNGSGILTVTDPGSVVTSVGSAIIGRAGSATLVVANHGTFLAQASPVGGGGVGIGSGSSSSNTYVGGSGSASVTGFGLLHSDTTVSVGVRGVSGTLDVSGGGTVEAATSFTFGITAIVSGVTETGSALVRVGAGGVLRALGAHVQGTAGITIGSGAGSTAVASVSGSGALMDSGGDPMFVGTFGTGSLTISGGGTVLAGMQYAGDAALNLGSQVGGVGTLTLRDVGSSLIAAGSLTVGNNGVGHLLVQSGGTLTSGFYADGVQGLVVGRLAGSSGDATVDGSQSRLINSGAFKIGRAGSGSLAITGGAQVSNVLTAAGAATGLDGATIGEYAGGAGQITVSGAGSAFTVNLNVVVGRAGSGSLSVANGGSVSVGTTLALGVSVGSSGTVSVDSTGMLEVGGSGGGIAGSLLVDAGGLLTGSGIVNAAIVNAGTILVSGAVATSGTVNTPGTLQLGAVSGNGTLRVGGTNTLQLAALGAGGTLFMDGDAASLRLTNPQAFAGAIVAPFGGTLDLVGVTVTGAVLSGGTLSVSTTTGTLALRFSGTGTIGFSDDQAGGSNIVVANAGGVVACFARGTRLATPHGPRAVEALRAGDRVLTAAGRVAPVAWVGSRLLQLARHPRPQDVMPVRVAAHAFAPGQPARDLLLSPDHAVFADGVLIPVRYLLNGVSITQAKAARAHYFHVELDRHDILLAEGLACESYLDTGNRHAFEGGPAPLALHPDFARQAWHGSACAELVMAGAALEAVRSHLLSRILAAGHVLTGDARPWLMAAGRRIDPASWDGSRAEFILPDDADSVTLHSRSAVPAEVTADSDDRRRLGMAVTGIEIDNAACALDDPRLGEGWHGAEPAWRWTDGAARIACGPACLLAILVAPAITYRLAA